MADPKHLSTEPRAPWYLRDPRKADMARGPKTALVFTLGLAILLVCIVALRWGLLIGDTVGRGYSPTYCRIP